jgi:hypothetical protein
MDPICELIIQHIETIVQAAVVIRVYRSRDAALASNQLPAIVVLPLLDAPSEGSASICWLDWRLTVALDILTGAGKDAAAHPYRMAIHSAMMADRNMSAVSGVMDVRPGIVQYQMDNRVGDAAFVRCPFDIDYRTRHDDLAVAP